MPLVVVAPLAVSLVLFMIIVDWVLALASWAMDITLMAGLRLARMPCSGIIIWMCIVALALDFTNHASFCRVLYGGEGDEAIRFMDMVLSEEKWIEEVESERRAVEELPVVKGSVDFFYSELSANLNKVQVTVWCCWAPAKRSWRCATRGGGACAACGCSGWRRSETAAARGGAGGARAGGTGTARAVCNLVSRRECDFGQLLVSFERCYYKYDNFVEHSTAVN